MLRIIVLALWLACISSHGRAADLVLWCIPETEEEAGVSEAVALRLIVENASNAHEIMLDAGSLWSLSVHREIVTETGETRRTVNPNRMSSYVKLVTLGPRQMFGRREELSGEDHVSIQGLLNGTTRIYVSARYREKDSEEVKRMRLEAIPLVPIGLHSGNGSMQRPGAGKAGGKPAEATTGPGSGVDGVQAPAIEPASGGRVSVAAPPQKAEAAPRAVDDVWAYLAIGLAAGLAVAAAGACLLLRRRSGG